MFPAYETGFISPNIVHCITHLIQVSQKKKTGDSKEQYFPFQYRCLNQVTQAKLNASWVYIISAYPTSSFSLFYRAEKVLCKGKSSHSQRLKVINCLFSKVSLHLALLSHFILTPFYTSTSCCFTNNLQTKIDTRCSLTGWSLFCLPCISLISSHFV